MPLPEDLKVNVSPNGDCTVLFGSAPEPLPIPKAVKISGAIDAPARFAKSRKDAIEPKLAHVVVNKINRSIVFVTDETNPINKEVTGKLDIEPELLAFKINQDKLYSVKELADLLRMRRQFFRDPEKHGKILKALGDFSAKTTIEFKEADDRKGNAEELRKRVSEVKLELSFVLKIPIYKTFPDKTFTVEILVDVTDGGVRMWLESVELNELLKKDLDEIFAAQVKSLSDYVVIEQ